MAELNRYAAFLDTDLSYEWSKDRFDTIDWMGIADRLTGGLIPALSKRVRSRSERTSSEGDVSVWPFTRAADVPEGLVR